MSCSLKIRERSNGGDTLKPIKCDFCNKGISTSHVCRFQKPDGKFAIEPRNGEAPVPICGMAFCTMCDQACEIKEQRSLCPVHRQNSTQQNLPSLQPDLNLCKPASTTMSKSKPKKRNKPAIKSTKKAAKKTRTVFKKKQIRAPFAMYLKDEHCNKYSSNPIVKNAMMVGTIKLLGNTSGQQYFIQWDETTMPESVLKDHLQVYFPHTAKWKKEVLKKAREDYDLSVQNFSSSSATSTNGLAESPAKDLLQKEKMITNKKKLNLSIIQNDTAQHVLDDIITGQSIGNEASYLGYGADDSDIEDISVDSAAERDYDLEEHSAYDGGTPIAMPAMDKINSEDIGYNDNDDSNRDGISMQNIKWNFKDFTGDKDTGLNPSGDYATKPYTGTDRLKPHAKEKAMDNVKECVEKFGGLDFNYFNRLTLHSNDYAQNRMKNGHFAGSPWVPISYGEMVRFHGILLRMSIDNRKVGGYETYFSESCSNIQVTQTYVRNLHYLEPWANKIMNFKRFKQIRAAYHHEKTRTSKGDKCWQIRYVINKLNATSLNTFIPAKHLAFDEGGISCRSRYCIVRMYNPSKPDPYRVEYFVMSSSTFPYEVIYIDIYQGKNPACVGVVNEHKGIPTTQRVVLDAALKTCIGKHSDGYRTIWLDNRYACPELLVNLLFRYEIRAAGTCRTNRKGWQKDKFTMPKNAPRGTMLQQYDEKNQLLEIQWKDSKVFGFVSTIEKSGTTTVKRQSGSQKIDVICPPAIKEYGKYMGGVDQGDYYRKKSGGFAGKSHFKKWHKKAALAVNDFMLLNAWGAWSLIRMVNDEFSQHMMPLSHAQFVAVYAEELCCFYDEFEMPTTSLIPRLRREHKLSGANIDHEHTFVKINRSVYGKTPSCVVCRIESNWIKIKDTFGSGPKSQSDLVQCEICGLIAHCGPPKCERKIFSIFEGKTCFQIAHEKKCSGLWSKRKKNSVMSWEVKKNHPMYKKLMVAHGVEHRPRKKQQQKGEIESIENDTMDTDSDEDLDVDGSQIVSL